MERDGQVDLSLLVGESSDGRGQPHGRDGEAPRPEVKSVRVVELVNRAQRVVVIVEGFAHAHDDHVGDALPVFVEQARIVHHLRHNLAAAEVTPEAHLSRGAEDASHGAACLRGNANCVAEGEVARFVLRVACSVFHEDRFDDFSVVEFEQGLDGLLVGGGELRGRG